MGDFNTSLSIIDDGKSARIWINWMSLLTNIYIKNIDQVRIYGYFEIKPKHLLLVYKYNIKSFIVKTFLSIAWLKTLDVRSRESKYNLNILWLWFKNYFLKCVKESFCLTTNFQNSFLIQTNAFRNGDLRNNLFFFICSKIKYDNQQ